MTKKQQQRFLERKARRELRQRATQEKEIKKKEARLLREKTIEQKRKQRQEQEAAERPEKNRIYLEKLALAQKVSAERLDSRSLLEVTASGMVPDSTPEVLDAVKQLGQKGRDILRKPDSWDKIVHDHLLRAESIS